MSVAPRSQIGTTFSVYAGEPVAWDETSCDLLSMIEVEGVVMIPETGVESEQGSVNLLKDGFTSFWNGTKSFPPFTIPYLYDESDAGQIILRAGNNTDTLHTFLIERPTGRQTYIKGYIANIKDSETTTDSYEGQTVTIRPVGQPVTGSTS